MYDFDVGKSLSLSLSLSLKKSCQTIRLRFYGIKIKKHA